MNIRRALVILAAVALPLAACGDDNPDTPAATSAAGTVPATVGSTATTSSEATTTTVAPTTTVALSTALDGATFVSTGVEGYTLVDGTQVQLTFDGQTVGANAGCNQLSSSWSLDGDVLVVPSMAQTQMACSPTALMDQDTWLAAVLTSKPTLAIDGDTLTITADGSTVTLSNSAATAPPLEGTLWTVESLVSGSTASSVPAGVRPPTVMFEGGTVSVDTGCNTGSGSYTVGPSTLTIGPIATTRMACGDAASEVERTVLGVLSGPIIWGIDDGVLSLRNGDTGLLLRAPAAGGDAAADALVGPTWTLDSTLTTNTATAANTATAVPAGVRTPTLVFDGTDVAVDAGCNTGSGSYTAAGNELTFGPLALTMMACAGPAGDIESAVLGVLTGTATFEVVDGVLTLMNGANGLRYVAG